MIRILHKDLSYQLTGICFKVHKELGQFASERQYADKFEELLNKEDISYFREYELKNLKPGSPKGNRVDFAIQNKIIIDLKAKQFITKEDYYQMQRYLKAADLELGMIINFRAYRLSPKRVLNSGYSGHLDSN
jgi:GxxExxY protein